ncbi:hypothetical protein F0562_013584 [Nyssa sinensis]|uniref:Uncharacterized protein n=1 Tax=Nyssa sinensis TaxID=561372 RepID=A0A5J4ZNU0_9ASTE|nr:hypothetical protein F0562_013584 [Nyssa sinensis]
MLDPKASISDTFVLETQEEVKVRPRGGGGGGEGGDLREDIERRNPLQPLLEAELCDRGQAEIEEAGAGAIVVSQGVFEDEVLESQPLEAIRPEELQLCNVIGMENIQDESSRCGEWIGFVDVWESHVKHLKRVSPKALFAVLQEKVLTSEIGYFLAMHSGLNYVRILFSHSLVLFRLNDQCAPL